MKKLVYILLVLALQAKYTSAQGVFNKMHAGEQNVYLNIGYDPTITTTLGYGRSFELKSINRDLTLTIDYTLPVFLIDFKHYKLEIGSRIALFKSENWNVINSLSVIEKKTDNPVYTGNLYSVNETLLFGHFSSKWFIAGEIGYEKFLRTKIEHTDWYKESVHPDAQDGWYSSTGGNISLGLQGGYKMGERIELSLRAGIYNTESFNAPAGAPYYGNIGINYHFKSK